MVLLALTRKASFCSRITSTTVDVVGQTIKLRRLRLTVRVPWRTGPSGRINRHCGLHWGIRRKSLTSAQTFETGALISTCACNSGAAIGRVPPSSGPSFSVGIGLIVQSGLCATRATTGGVTLPQKDGGAQHPDTQPGQCQR